MVSPEPRDPPDEAAFCDVFKLTIEDLALFESDWKFSERIQSAIPHRWFKEVGHIINDVYKLARTTEGLERACWMDAFLRMTAPKLGENDIFAAWRGSPPVKKLPAKPPK